MTNLKKQRGVSLIEVMVALSILMIMALATSGVQVGERVSVRMSNIHFTLEYLSSDIVETLRSEAAAASDGAFDFDSSDEGVSGNAQTRAWNDRIVDVLPEGGASVACTDNWCDVSINWMEEIDGSYHRLVYNAGTPL